MRSKETRTSERTRQAPGTVPRLRFPGFLRAWEIFPLGDIATFIKGKGLPKSAITDSGQIPCIHYGELFTEYAEAIHEVRNRTHAFDGAMTSQPNDVLMPTSDVTPSGLAKASALMMGGVLLGGDILVIRLERCENSGEFLARSIRSSEREVLKLVSGSTVFHLYASSMAKFLVAICDEEEQRRIASCLSSLDACIGAETRKLDALKVHKQGLMQQLFPAEGQRLRFSGFEDEWETKLLRDVAPLQRGFDLPSNQLREGKVPVVYSNGVQNFHDTGMATAPGIVTGRSGTIGKINFVAIGEYWPHNTALWVTSFCGNVPLFVYYLLNSIGMERFSSGSGVPTLNRNDVHIFQVHIPSPTEQTRIASCLSSLDNLLAAQSRKIDTLKQHKKGLMQGLFPVMEAHAP